MSAGEKMLVMSIARIIEEDSRAQDENEWYNMYSTFFFNLQYATTVKNMRENGLAGCEHSRLSFTHT